MKKTRTLKRTLSVLLTAMMILSSLVIMPLTANAAALTGSGTDADPYKIGSAEAFTEFKAVLNAGGTVYAQLTADIDMGGATWNCKGSGSLVLNFDGNDHSISNVVLDGSTHASLFGELGSGCTISNVHLKNIDCTATAAVKIGAFSIYAKRGLQMYNCSVDAASTFVGNGTNFVGGFIGTLQGGSDNRDTIFSGCTNNATVTNNVVESVAGGFAGTIETVGESTDCKLTFINCTNNGDVSGGGRVGGFVGFIHRINNAIFTNSTNTGDITSTTHRAGGFLCDITSNGNCPDVNVVFDGCQNTGNILAGSETFTSTVCVGGLVAYSATLTDFLLENSINEGTVTAKSTNENYAGGFIGYANGDTTTGGSFTFRTSYNAGAISAGFSTATGPARAGGFVGFMQYMSYITFDTCANRGGIHVDGTRTYVAALLGATEYTANVNKVARVTNCYNTGALSGTLTATDTTAGLFCGYFRFADAVSGKQPGGWADLIMDQVYDNAAHTLQVGGSAYHAAITGWSTGGELDRILTNCYGVVTSSMRLNHATKATIITATGTTTATNCAHGMAYKNNFLVYYNLDVVETASTTINLCKNVNDEWVFDRTTTISAEIARIEAEIQAAMDNTGIVKEAAENLSIEPGNLEIRLRLVEPFGFMAITSLKDDGDTMVAYSTYTSVAEVGFAFLNGNEDDANTVLTTGKKVQGAKYNNTEKFYATFEELLASKLKDTISFVAYVIIGDTTYVSGVRTIVVYNEVVDCCDGMYGTSVAIPEAEKKVYVAMKEYADAYYDYLGK